MPDEDPQPREPRNGGGPPKPPMRMSRGAFSWIIIIGLALMLMFMLNQSMGGANTISITDFWTYLQNGQIKSVTIKDDRIEGEFTHPPKNAPATVKSFLLVIMLALLPPAA